MFANFASKVLVILTRLAQAALFSLPFAVLGHEGEEEALYEPTFWAGFFSYDFMTIVWLASGIIAFAVIAIWLFPPQSEKAKVAFFLIISSTAVLTTFYLAGGTIYENVVSFTGGPVHWHADYRIFNCGKEIELVDPTGLANRVGTPDVHEHNDGRIHIEGTLATSKEATLHNFFDAVGGELSREMFAIKTNSGLVELKNGTTCNGGSPGTLQVFLWETIGLEARQRKIADFENYVISPEQLVPPGDCVIVEFDFERGKTEYVCEQYGVAEKRGDIIIVR